MDPGTPEKVKIKSKPITTSAFKNCRRLLHWGPCFALSIIFLISFMSVTCTLMWWPVNTMGGLLNLLVFMMWDTLTLYNYFMAVFNGPGFVPYGWRPKNPEDEQHLQYCQECKGFKVPRSHHCRKCKRCVMKMDHHCPWINTCCGYLNHANFIYFLLFAPCGCIHGAVILIASSIHTLNLHYFRFYANGEPMVELSILGFILVVFTIGLAVGVVVAVGMLFFIQFHEVLKNETGIETWIIEKAKTRERSESEGEFIFPYHLGWKKNLKLVFWSSGEISSNGIHWPVRDSCHQFTLTTEQLKQKALKREHVVLVTIIENYSGSWLPISKGCKVIYNIPCTDEVRIPVNVGDQIEVTRGKRHWLYGQKVPENKNSDDLRIRGWFPRRCAKRENEVENHDSSTEDSIEDDNGKKKKLNFYLMADATLPSCTPSFIKTCSTNLHPICINNFF